MTELQESILSDIARQIGYKENATMEEKAFASSLLSLLGAHKLGASVDLNTHIIQKVNEYLQVIGRAKVIDN